MTRAHRPTLLLALFLTSALSACAPVILGRTPMPAEVGHLEVINTVGVPLPLTGAPVPPPEGPLERIFALFRPPSEYAPTPSLGDFIVAYGVAPGTEVNAVISVGPLPGLRLGGKTLLLDAQVRLAADYGVYLSYTNGGVDAGLLVSTLTDDAELYAGLRGFDNFPYGRELNTTLAGALTLGRALPFTTVRGEQRFLLELALLAHGYSGRVFLDEVQPVGFTLMPAIGFTF